MLINDVDDLAVRPDPTRIAVALVQLGEEEEEVVRGVARARFFVVGDRSGDSSRTFNYAGSSGTDMWQLANQVRKADAAYDGISIKRASTDGVWDHVQTLNGGSVDSDFDEFPADPSQTVYGGVLAAGLNVTSEPDNDD
ncbi:MAG: hypothetical protein OXD50_08335 [Chloroflexi bacterium]|nr:hypothetical protein [Chloroflexota bacterium]